MTDIARTRLKTAMLFVMLVAFGLRVYELDRQSLWLDEGFGVLMAQRDLVSLYDAAAADFHPPLYYYLLKLSVGLAGTSEFSVRYLSVLLGVLFVPLSYVVTARLFGKQVAFVVSLLAVFSPFYIHYSQEVRMYALMALLSQLAVYFFLRAISTGRGRDWIGYGAFILLAMYSHLYAVFTLVFLDMAFLILAIPIGKVKQAIWKHRQVRFFLLSQIAVAVLFVPWLQLAVEKFASFVSPGRGSSLDWILEQTLIVFSLGHNVLGINSFPGSPEYDADLSLALVLALPFVLMAVWGSVMMFRNSRRPEQDFLPLAPGAPLRNTALFSVGFFLVPLALIFLLSMGKLDFNGRYLFVASPAYYALIAVGLVTAYRSNLGRVLTLSALLLFAGIWVFSLNNYFYVEKYSRDDHRSAMSYLLRNALPGDLVILDSDFDTVFKYYGGDKFPWIRFPESKLPDNRQTIGTLARVVPKYERAWLVMWGDYYVDPDRIVQGWLDENAFRMDGKVFHGPIIIYGYLTKPPILEAPARPGFPKAASFEDQVTLLGYDMESEGNRSQGRIHLTLYMQAQQKLAANYSIFAQLVNTAGHTLGSGDSQPVNGYLPTTEWKPGETVRNELDIWILPAAPPGDYRLLVGIYDQSTMRRLHSEGSDSVALGSVHLAKRTVDARDLDLQRATSVQFGDSIQLIGYRIDRPWPENLRVTLFWKTSSALPRRYAVFNHLLDSAGGLVAQKDGEPGAGLYPTDRWESGEVIRDVYDIPLPNGLNGEFRLFTGLYAPETGERLPIRDWLSFRSPKSSFELERVRITR